MAVNEVIRPQPSNLIEQKLNNNTNIGNAAELFEQILQNYKTSEDEESLQTSTSSFINEPQLIYDQGQFECITEEALLFKPTSLLFGNGSSIEKSNPNNEVFDHSSTQDFITAIQDKTEMQFVNLDQRLAYVKKANSDTNQWLKLNDEEKDWSLIHSPVLTYTQLTPYDSIPFDQNIELKIGESQEGISTSGTLKGEWFAPIGAPLAQFYDEQLKLLRKVTTDKEVSEVLENKAKSSALYTLNNEEALNEIKDSGLASQLNDFNVEKLDNQYNRTYLLQDDFIHWKAAKQQEVEDVRMNLKPDALENRDMAVSVIKQIKHHLYGKEVGEHIIHVKLKPESLGGLDITYKVGDDGYTQLLVTMEKMSTFLLMKQNAEELKNLLPNYSQNNEGDKTKLYLNWQGSFEHNSTEHRHQHAWKETEEKEQIAELSKIISIKVTHGDHIFDLEV